MKSNVCFVSNSFDLSRPVEDVTESFAKASALIKKMSTDFVLFSKANDFDDSIAMAIATRGFDEMGHLYSAAYDGRMCSLVKSDFVSSKLTDISNKTPPELEHRWISLYSDVSTNQLTLSPIRTTYDEMSLVSYCTEILRKNVRSDDQYAYAFKDIYQNLFFRTNEEGTRLLFNRLNKISGGCKNFIIGITTCLEFMNGYSVIPNDSLKNIDEINGMLDVPVTPEGKGKGQRGKDELKRDFFINNVKYEHVNCEFHCKLQYKDGAPPNGQPKPYRIYFGFVKPGDLAERIAIAHIGEHW